MLTALRGQVLRRDAGTTTAVIARGIVRTISGRYEPHLHLRTRCPRHTPEGRQSAQKIGCHTKCTIQPALS